MLHILNLLDDEARLLNEQFTHIYFGGMSQGMAIALWAFLGAIGTGRVQGALGGLLGFCGWLPFAQQLDDLLSGHRSADTTQTLQLVSEFFFDTIAGPAAKTPVDSSILSNLPLCFLVMDPTMNGSRCNSGDRRVGFSARLRFVLSGMSSPGRRGMATGSRSPTASTRFFGF